jgi:protein tyrosine phosphatase (PTP) superfamily phosphohydrolase (DUF442 family)
MRVGPWLKKPWVILLFVFMLTTIRYARCRIDTRNFQTVVPGTVYRSGQLIGGQWAAYLQKYAIKSLLNLRGERRASGWYQEEMRMAVQLGVTHYDVKLSAIREVDSGMLETILAIMRQAPKPLLIHCRSGADRSGLIAAMYLFAIEGQRAEAAAQQLSIFYGHFPYLFSRSGAMDRSFWRYVGRPPLQTDIPLEYDANRLILQGEHRNCSPKCTQ